MVLYSDLPGQYDAIADPDAAGNAHLRDDEAVPADFYVMADVHLTVDLGSFPDDSVAKRAPVDGHVGPDVDVVLDYHPANVWNPLVSAGLLNKAEPLTANDRAALNKDPITDPDLVEDCDAGLDSNVGADDHVLADV